MIQPREQERLKMIKLTASFENTVIYNNTLYNTAEQFD